MGRGLPTGGRSAVWRYAGPCRRRRAEGGCGVSRQGACFG